MKSKSPLLFVVLGVAAVALWFAATAKKTPPEAARPAPPTVLQPSVPAPSEAPTVAGNQPPAGDEPAGRPPTSNGSSPATGAVTTPAIPLATPAVNEAGAAPARGEAALPPDKAAQADVGRVRHMVGDFHTLMGENPVGTNAEIMKQLMGGNPRQATLGPPEGMVLNAEGELVDQWGSAYFFHQLSKDRMEVRSAGPDKVMWTADDIVTR